LHTKNYFMKDFQGFQPKTKNQQHNKRTKTTGRCFV
jgi:hypothetical protein